MISGGETMTALDADAIGRAFGCRVVNHYGAWEVPHMAQTCPDNPDVMHVNSERVVLRVVREDGRPAAPGTPGRIVVTALDNYVMPFINYEIGDTGVVGGAVLCGRGFPTLARVEGRLGEVIQDPGGADHRAGDARRGVPVTARTTSASTRPSARQPRS